MIKKLIKCGLFTFLSVGFISSFCFGLDLPANELDPSFPYGSKNIEALKCDSTNLGDCTSIKEDEKNPVDNTIIRRLLGVFGLDTSPGKDLKFMDYAKAIINMALGLIASVALIMTIYTFYMVMFSGNEDGIKKAKGNLVNIFIALAVVGLAWIIVSFIFRWYQSNWKGQEKDIAEGNISMIIDQRDNNQIYLTI